MKSKRAREAATAEAEDFLPVNDVPSKKRKRNDDDPARVKKAKKDKRDKRDKRESRKEKKDKRKNIQDLPEEEDAGEEAHSAAQAASSQLFPVKKESNDGAQEDLDGASQVKDKDKDKDKAKAKKGKTPNAKRENTPPAAEQNTNTNTNTDGDGDGDGKGDGNGDGPADRKSRYIVFVGNLPFSATVATIRAHFASLHPTSVRCLKNKDDPNPCRGIAFVEFANVWTMRTCLDKFHHTVFEDGVSPGRKINVELTAGGGGGTKFRKDKIREKNKKLDENRTRRIEKEKKNAKLGDGKGRDDGDEIVGMHPSRLARNPRLGN